MCPMSDDRFDVRPIATVESRLTDLATAPKQADEGAPEAWLVFAPEGSTRSRAAGCA